MAICWQKFGMFVFISFLVVFFLLIVFRNQNQNQNLISIVVENILHGIHLTGTMQSAVMVKSTMRDVALDHPLTKNEKDDRWVQRKKKRKRNKNQHFGRKWPWVKDFYEIRKNCNYRTVTFLVTNYQKRLEIGELSLSVAISVTYKSRKSGNIKVGIIISIQNWPQ